MRGNGGFLASHASLKPSLLGDEPAFGDLSLRWKFPFPARGGDRFDDWVVGHQFEPYYLNHPVFANRRFSARRLDPVGMELARIEMPDIQYSRDPYECANGADALVIVTEWEQFRALDLDRLKREMVCPVVVDLRNVYDPRELTRRGFLYQSIGRAN